MESLLPLTERQKPLPPISQNVEIMNGFADCQFQKLLGKGSHGKVYKARRRTGEAEAVKVICKKPDMPIRKP